jgi:uncharacterized lipoprotein YehR (DUF1307 family)
MKKMTALMVAAIMVLALAACGTPAKRHSYRAIKCPACAYEFQVPADGGG